MDAPILNSDAHRLQTQVLNVRLDPDRHQDLFTVQGFFGPVLGHGNRYTIGPRSCPCNTRAGHDIYTVAFEAALQYGAYVFVLGGHQPGQQLDDRYFHAVHAVDIGELNADGAPANDDDAGRELVEDDRLAAGDDLVAVHGERRDGAGAGAGGEDDVLGVEPLSVGGNLNHSFARQPSGALDVLHVILPQQERNAPGVAVNHSSASRVSHGVVGVEIIKA